MVEDRQSDFGGLLRRHRLRALLTQEQLAERAGMSPRAVGGLERGTVHSPRGSSVQLLADALALTGATRDAFVAAGRGDGSRLGGPATAAARSGAASAGAETSPPAAGPGWPAGPFLLPPDIADFTGRADVVDLLCDLLAKVTEGTAEPTAVAVGAVAGKAGVGKTTLAVHVAHRLRDRFPDGQLYAELGGVHSHPLDPSRVLGWFLRALGIEGGAIPETLEERAGLYRGLLAGRRVLVVLDDAGYGAQVRPLLPGSPSCAVLVTSRSRLAELAGAPLIELDVLDPQQAITLLGRVAGQQRVAAESDAAAAIAVACGRLPLALRVAGARLAARPHWRLTRLAGRLADERRRLDELALGDLEVRASVGLSYDGLEGEQRRAFRLLGLLEASTFAAWVAAALLDVEAGQGEELVEALVDAQLLEVAAGSPAGHGRYRFHDLVRLVAREQAVAQEPEADRRAALERALGGWLALAERADARLPTNSFGLDRCAAPRWQVEEPTVEGLLADPLAWFESERAALLAAISQAGTAGFDTLAWGLAGALEGVFLLRNDYDGWRQTSALGLAAARRSQDRWAEAHMLRSVGDYHTHLDHEEEAVGYHHQAIRVFGDVDDRRGAAYCLRALASLYRVQGRFVEALSCAEQALAAFRGCGDRGGEAYAVQELGSIRADQGTLEEAVMLLECALEGFRELGDRSGTACALRRLGRTHLRQGHLDQARIRLSEALRLFQNLGGRLDIAYVHQQLGELNLRCGNLGEARSLSEQALAICAQFGDGYGQAMALHTLGQVCGAEGEFGQAQAHLQRSSQVLQAIGLPLAEARTLSSLGEVQATAGQLRAARSSWGQALELFRQLGAVEAVTLAARIS